jgi:hypothetical protein
MTVEKMKTMTTTPSSAAPIRYARDFFLAAGGDAEPPELVAGPPEGARVGRGRACDLAYLSGLLGVRHTSSLIKSRTQSSVYDTDGGTLGAVVRASSPRDPADVCARLSGNPTSRSSI